MATLARRVIALNDEIDRLDTHIAELVRRAAPALLDLYGVGADTAAILLAAAGDNPERIRYEAAWAHLCGVAPLPASSGKTTRHRLNPGGNRQTNHALWHIAFTRMSSDKRTRVYVERRVAEGLTKPEIMRVLKRYIARETYRHLRATNTRSGVAGWPENALTPPAVLRSICRPVTPNHRRTAWPNKSSPSIRVAHHWSASTPVTTLDNT